MDKYKIGVYAISKNEELFVDRWMDSLEGASEIVVLDTGSTDKTVSKLRKRGAKVTIEEIKPWRFDIARNKALSLLSVDCDICISIDLDEIIEAGWKEELEAIWDANINRLAYNYNWSFDQYGNPAVNFYIEKIHDRHNYCWHHPVHEVLKYIGDGEENKKTTDDITVNHYPDITKPRGQYLSLLELAVEEDPEDDRNMHYLGREYMYQKRYYEAIDTFHHHLKMPNSKWLPERAASMRFMARCYKSLNKLEEAKLWFEKAILECSTVREGFVELGLLEYEENNYHRVIQLLKMALNIEKRNKIYINEHFCWDSTIYDVLSVCCYQLKNYEEAYGYVCKALKLDPKNKRIKTNKKLIMAEAKL